MSSAKPDLIWAWPGPLTRVVDAATDRLRAALRTPLRSARARAVRLDAETVFRTRFHVPSSSPSLLKRALLQALPGLSPLPIDQISVFARPSGRRGEVELAILRRADSKVVDQTDAFATDADGSVFLSRRGLRRRRAGQAALSLAAALLLFGAPAWMDRAFDQRRAALAETRREAAALTAELKRRVDASRRLSAVETYLETNPSARTPAGMLGELGRLSDATPRNAWWLNVDMSDRGTDVTGMSASALESLSAMDAALPDRTVRSAKPVIAEADGRESFVARIESKGAPQ